MGTRIKAACYCRVSTLLGQSVENQVIPIREYCQNRGFELSTEREYCDEGQSGAKERRPALDRMLKDARAGKFKVVCVAGLDRLARNVRHCLTVLDELNALGVKFISLRENIDLSTPQGQMTMTVLAAVAQLERELTRARVRETLAAKKLLAQQTGNGWKCGRPSVVTGDIVNQVIELRGRGLSVRAIETALGKRISRATVERILKAKREHFNASLKTLDESGPKISVISTLENGDLAPSKRTSFEPNVTPLRTGNHKP